MSNSNHFNPLFDASVLEKLANEFFTKIPGSSNSDNLNHQVSETAGEALLQPKNIVSQNTGFTDGHDNIPQSLAGSGRSLSSLNNGNKFNLEIPLTNLPATDEAGTSNIPHSVAGSGISPSALNQDSNFDLKVPVTSLPDPNEIGSNKIPKSVAGSGASPTSGPHGFDADNASPHHRPSTVGTEGYGAARQSHQGFGVSPFEGPATSAGYAQEAGRFGSLGGQEKTNLVSNTKLPFEAEQPFNSELQEVLNNIRTYVPHQEIPELSQNSQFYFLNEAVYSPFEKEEHRLISKDLNFGKGLSGIASPPFDVGLVRRDFPVLKERVNGRPLIWLDNAATTQKPNSVIERISYFYRHENSNIHRAAHELAARATDAYEAARQKVQLFLNAASPKEIVFVRGATEAVNLVAKSWGEQYLQKDDEIIISHLEHHANIVPWQQLAMKKGLKIRVIPVDNSGQIILEEYTKLLSSKTKLVAFTQVSNALGTITPAKRITELAHQAGAKVLVDGAQSVSHMRVDVRDLNADWFVFSGHKVFAPTGIGVLYGKEAILNESQPWQGGGNMIKDVTFENTQFHDAPGRFEAGTGNIADAVGLGAAIDYVNKIGIELINKYEHYLLVYATKLLREVPGLKLIGTAENKASVISFVLQGYETEQVGAALNQEGIAVRSGHHCAQPILRRFGLESTVRPSLAFYNTCEEIDTLVSVLHRLSSKRK